MIKLRHDLSLLGVQSGDILILHSSFKTLGQNELMPVDVIRLIIDVLGNEGTLMVPTFTYSYAGIWNVSPYDREKTPGVSNGILTEILRTWPGALRSDHPTYSVAAFGKYAHQITANKEHASALGRGSSYEEALNVGAKILLLGVGNNRNSMLHYAEVAAELPYNDIPFRRFWGNTALIEKNGRVLKEKLLEEYPGCSQNMGVADEYLLGTGVMRQGKILSACSFLMDSRSMVNAIVEQVKKKPTWLLCNNFVCEPCTLRKRRLKERGLI